MTDPEKQIKLPRISTTETKLTCPHCNREFTIKEHVEIVAPVEITLDDVKGWFTEFKDNLSIYEEEGKIIIMPTKFLGPELFGKVYEKARKYGIKYVSAGRMSHFEIEKVR